MARVGWPASLTHSLTHSPTHCHALIVTHSLSLTHSCLLAEWWVVHLTGYGSLVRWFVGSLVRCSFVARALSFLLAAVSIIHPLSTLHSCFVCLFACLLVVVAAVFVGNTSAHVPPRVVFTKIEWKGRAQSFDRGGEADNATMTSSSRWSGHGSWQKLSTCHSVESGVERLCQSMGEYVDSARCLRRLR